jgi:hypothetical protein
MDSLASLPPKNDTVKTQEETEIINQLFPENPSQPNQPPSPQNTNNPQNAVAPAQINPQQFQKNAPPAKINWKLLGATICAFLLFANPWIDGLLSKIPYCSGTSSILGIKVLLFSIILVLLNIYM